MLDEIERAALELLTPKREASPEPELSLYKRDGRQVGWSYRLGAQMVVGTAKMRRVERSDFAHAKVLTILAYPNTRETYRIKNGAWRMKRRERLTNL